MNKIAIIVIIFCVFPFLGFTQSYIISDLTTLYDQYTVDKGGRMSLVDPNIEGSPYLFDAFFEGEVIIDDSILITNVPLRYNIYNDKMEFKNGKNQVMEIGIQKIAYEFNFEDLSYRNLDYLEDEIVTHGILELLVDGKVKLFKKYNIKLEPATKAIGFQDATSDRFVRKEDQYLIVVGHEKPHVFGNIKKQLPELQKIKPDINSFVKSEKIRLRSEKGLIALIQYCND